MSQRVIYELLKEIGKADIEEIFKKARSKKLKQPDSRVKIRDSLILLSRNGYVKQENGKWVIVQGIPEPQFKQIKTNSPK